MIKQTFLDVCQSEAEYYIEEAKESGDLLFSDFLRNQKVLFDDGMELWKSVCSKKPYYRLRGKPITPKQAMEIIRRTDLHLETMQGTANLNHTGKRYCGKDFISAINFYNIWLEGEYCLNGFGWCHPDGTIGLNSATSKYPNLTEFLIEWLTYAYCFPYLDVVVALTDSDSGLSIKGVWADEVIAEHNRYAKNKIDRLFTFEESVMLGIYLHNGILEILNAENAVNVYIEYHRKYGVGNEQRFDDRFCKDFERIDFDEYRDKCIALNREINTIK